MKKQIFTVAKIFILTLVLSLRATTVSFAADGGFSDVPADHWAHDAVMYVDSMNLVHHYDGNLSTGSALSGRQRGLGQRRRRRGADQ